MPTSVTVTRHVAASPADVYAAWVQPELLERWMGPVGDHVSQIEGVPAPGASVVLHFAGALGGSMEWHYAEAVPGERLVILTSFTGPRADLEDTGSRLTVTFTATQDGGTDVDVVHDRLDREPDGVMDGARDGWTGTLGKLAAAVEA